MGKPNFLDLGSLTGTGAGTAFDISHLESIACLIGGTFVGTVDIEVSFDAGTTFVALPSPLGGATAPVVGDVGVRAQQIRANCTAFTSGTIEVKAAGEDADVRG